MRLPLDTHLLLWAAGSSERLPLAARELLDDAQNVPVFSSASLWEAAIKRGLGRKGYWLAQLQPPTGGPTVQCRSHFLSGAQRQAMGLLLVG
jgi:hypothetical protein